MMKKFGIGLGIGLLIAALYYIELNKVKPDTSGTIQNLDNLETDESGRNWDVFYRVRATIIDGQSADFSIPDELTKKVGEEMSLSGAAVFFGPGCKEKGDKISVHSFFLLPTLGFAEACSILPDVAMRWTIMVNLKEEWIIDRSDMIRTMVDVKGNFRIDTSKPYDAAFFLDESDVNLIRESE